jgi:DNA polymerase I-like protein with 3'-5' exonuclease and polymerase domains
VGFSELAKVLNAGGDPHAMIAATLLGIPLEEVLRRKKDPDDMPVYLARQAGKIANFGLPAGLGWKSLVVQARAKYDVILDEEGAKKLIAAWLVTWPEFAAYFKFVKGLCGQSGHMTVVQYKAERYRGLTPYTVACNSYFQGLGADATLAALWALQKECYVGKGPLLGSRLVNYVHDQYIVETDEESAHDAATQLDQVVTDAANVWLPDVPIKGMSPMLVRRWSKSADKVRGIDGRLIPWEWQRSATSDEQYAQWWKRYVG